MTGEPIAPTPTPSGDGTPPIPTPATDPATPPKPATPEDENIDKIAEKVMEKLRGAFKPGSGAPGGSLRDIEETARRAVVDAIPTFLKEKEQESIIQELKDKVEKITAPVKYKGLLGWLFPGDEK